MEVIYSELNQLKENKAPGGNMFAQMLLKEVENEIRESLCIIFNKSLQECICTKMLENGKC